MDPKRCLKRRNSATSDSSMKTFASTSSVVSNTHAKIFRLKSENMERFTDVVLMHLSFLMDLNDVKFEELMEMTPQEKPNLLSVIRRRPTKGVFATKLNNQALERIFPLIEFLGKSENCQKEGIFRLSGGLDRQRELRELIENDEKPVQFDDSKFTVNDVATVFKSFLSELPEPLLLEKNFNAYKQISGMKDERKQIECLQLLNQLLPNENAILLCNLLSLLNKVASLHDSNKMTSENLSLIFTPHLFIPKKIPIMQLKEAADNLRVLVVLMVNNASTMFDYPSHWIKDAIKYSDDVVLSSANGKRDSSMRTPFKRFKKAENDEDGLVLSTHISFADRQASMKAAKSINTEQALSELYNYIQTLPESGKKRKLLKGFDSPSTPKSTKKDLSVTFKKFVCQRNIFGGSNVPFIKLFDDEDAENFDPAIICNSILLSDNEDV